MSDSISEDELNKWMCEYCTYENFQSSLKCTMCAGHKPLLNEDIFRYKYAPLFGVYICNYYLCYRLSPSQQQCDNYKQIGSYASSTPSSCIVATETGTFSTPHKQQIGSLPTSPIPKIKNQTTITEDPPPPSTNNQQNSTKWECLNCTHLNLINSNRCTQCDSAKQQQHQHLNINAINNDVNDQMKSLSICGSDPDLQLAAIGQHRSSPMGSTANLSGSRTNLGAGARVSPVDSKGNCYPMHKWSCSVSHLFS